jgi:predicted GNAT superfamily acetyltransferase
MTGVRIEQLTTVAQMRRVERLQMEIWGMGEAGAIPFPFLVASVHNGGRVLGAYEGDEMIGFAYGFPATRDGQLIFYSHMAGVLPQAQRHAVGYALKLAQRELALREGYRRMSWTFDPVQSVNAYFNLGKLGVEATRYFVNYYGDMIDELNRGLPSDRLEVDWFLDTRRVADRIAGRRSECAVDRLPLVLEAAGDEPRRIAKTLPDADVLRMEIPPSIAAVRERSLDSAIAWRLATRDVFLAAFDRGYVAGDFVRHDGRGYFIFQRRRIP